MNKRIDLWLTFLCTFNLLLAVIKADLNIRWFRSNLTVGIFECLIDILAIGWLVYRGNFKIIDNESVKTKAPKSGLPTDQVL